MRFNEKFRAGTTTDTERQIGLMCHHLRSAIDVFEQIAVRAVHEEREARLAPAPTPLPAVELPAEKLTYTVKDVVAAVAISRTALYQAMAEGKLKAVKFGHRTLIPAQELRRWIACLPPRGARGQL